MTTKITYDSKNTQLITKLSTKWAHSSEFTVEKLEIANDGKLSAETSFLKVLPGLRLTFKRNNSNLASLSFMYKHKFATLTGEVDALNFRKANASLCGGHGPFTANVSGDFKFPKGASAACDIVTVGASYTIPKSLVALINTKNFSDYTGVLQCLLTSITIAGKVKYNPKETCGTILAAYKCNPTTTINIKVGTSGTINASVKQQIDKKFVVVGAAEFRPKNLSEFKFGINATLG